MVSDRHAAHRVDRRLRRRRRRYRRAGSAACGIAVPVASRCHDLGEDRQGDLAGGAGTDVEPGRGVDAARSRRRCRRCSARAPALAAGDQADVGHVGRERGGQRRLLVPSVRGDHDRPRRPAGSTVASYRRDHVVAERGADPDQRAGRPACRRAPGPAAPASAAPGRSRGCRRTGTGCPRRSAFGLVRGAPVGPASVAGVIRSSTDSRCQQPQRLAAARSTPHRRRRRSPRCVPSARISALSPGFALVGRSARTTVAWTNGDAPGAAPQLGRPQAPGVLTRIAMSVPARTALHRPPHVRPGVSGMSAWRTPTARGVHHGVDDGGAVSRPSRTRRRPWRRSGGAATA